MANVKKDKYDVLAKVIDALYDENQEVKIETTTLDAKDARRHIWSIMDKSNPQIPTKQGDIKNNGLWSKNHEHAESIKIGKFSLRRIPLKATPTKDGKYLVDNGWKYIVRTPDGEEAEFGQTDKDFIMVWSAALTKYDFPVVDRKAHSRGMYRLMCTLYENLKNPKLKMAAGKGVTKKDEKTKFEKAKENLESLGVKTKDEDLKKILNRIQNKSKAM